MYYNISYKYTRVRNLFSKKSEHAGRLSKAARRRPILKVLLYARE